MHTHAVAVQHDRITSTEDEGEYIFTSFSNSSTPKNFYCTLMGGCDGYLHGWVVLEGDPGENLFRRFNFGLGRAGFF